MKGRMLLQNFHLENKLIFQEDSKFKVENPVSVKLKLCKGHFSRQEKPQVLSPRVSYLIKLFPPTITEVNRKATRRFCGVEDPMILLSNLRCHEEKEQKQDS